MSQNAFVKEGRKDYFIPKFYKSSRTPMFRTSDIYVRQLIDLLQGKDSENLKSRLKFSIIVPRSASNRVTVTFFHS